MRGSAMVTAMIVIIVGVIIVGGYLAYIGNQTILTKQLNDSIKAFYIAEAGLETALRQTYLDWYSDPDNKRFAANNIPETSFAGGTYEVSEYCTNITKRITSTGRYGNESRVVNRDAYVEMDIDLTSNVIASCGSTGGKITGNVEIMGSVFMLGEEPFVDSNENNIYDAGEHFLDVNNNSGWGPYLTSTDNAVEMGGTSKVGNNYIDMPSALKSRVPSIANDDGIETLDAKLMVKYGKVKLEGNASIGSEEVSETPQSKNTMDSVNVPDGFDVGDGVVSDFVHTDELLADRDRFNDVVRMPSLKDAYTDNATGTFYPAPIDPYGNPTEIGGYESYLMTKGFVVPGDLNIDTAPFSYSDAKGNSINYQRVKIGGQWSWLLTIQGLFCIDGSLNITNDIVYSGKGTFYVKGVPDADNENDVKIMSNVMTNGNFPNSIMGIMSRENIFFGGAQNKVMGLFYAADTIKCTKQYDVAGTFISAYFDMGTNVPRIFQVPVVEQEVNHPPYFIDTLFPGRGIVFDKWYETPPVE